MPYKRKPQKFRRRKRRFRKKSSWNYKSNALTLRKFTVMPKKFKFITRYFENDIRLNPGVGGTMASHVFRLNGLYDPNVTGVGHQPLGFDQIMQFYAHFTVIYARVNIQFTNTDTTYSQIVGAYIKNEAATESDVRIPIENGGCIWKLLTPEATGGRTNCSVNLSCNLSKFLGRSNILSEDDCRGSVSADPLEQAYVHIFAAPQTSADSAPVDAIVTIDYTAILIERETQILS